MVGVGILPLEGCMQLGVTGPILRSAGLAWDLRKVMPYCGYEDYDFEVPTSTDADLLRAVPAPGGRDVGIAEDHEAEREAARGARPGDGRGSEDRLARATSIGSDGMGNSLEYIRKIMGQSMESLIHHFKLVTEGFDVPAGQAYRRSRTRAVNWVATWCPTAAPGRCGCTCVTPDS